ncbi:MAG: hypothetical protein K2N74_00750 [Clostridiales bacterium]|nr:hypothetical protein [Clostridiales bacterium]
MGKEAIIERILADAEAEAQGILNDAEKQANEIVAKASARADAGRAETRAEVEERAKRISEGKAATARLEGAKLELAEKRRVIDTVYERALEELVSLNERDFLALTEKLLNAYAEEGDEIVFSKLYGYVTAVQKLPVFKERKLKLSDERADIRGGFLLRGKTADRDLSFSSLLNADREEHQSELAQEIFKAGKQ